MKSKHLPIISTIIVSIFSIFNASSATQKPYPISPFPSFPLSKLPSPPSTPPPDNKTTPGGGLEPLKTSCNRENKKLRALLPKKNPVLTTSNRPTLLFYIPDNPSDILEGEFWINSENEKQRIYSKTRFKLSKTPGIISVTFAENIPLEEGKYYHWYLKIYCNDATKDRADLDVHGWLKRVQLTPERQAQIEGGMPAIWYDALSRIARLLTISPEDEILQKRWSQLLESINAQDLVDKPQADSVELVDS